MAEGLEKKLAALTALNGVLKSENAALRRAAGEPAAAAAAAAGGAAGAGAGAGAGGGGSSRREVEELTREFTGRLAQVEDRMLAVADERDALRAQAQMEEGRTGRLEARAADAETRAEELRAEVQALSRGKGELDGECRRLKAQLRDSETALGALRDKAQGLETVARAGRDLEQSGAREALERVSALEAELQAERESRDKRVAAAVGAAERGAAEEYRVRIDGLGAKVETLQEQLSGALADAANRGQESTRREEALRDEVAHLEAQRRAAEAEREGAQMQASEAAEPLLRQLDEARRSGEAAAAKSGRVEAGLRKELEEARAELREAQKEARLQAGRAQTAEVAARRAQESTDGTERQLQQLRTRSDQGARAAQASQGELREANRQLRESAAGLEDKVARGERDMRDIERVVAGLEGKVAELTRERDEAQARLTRRQGGGGAAGRTEGGPSDSLGGEAPEGDGLLGGRLDDLLRALPGGAATAGEAPPPSRAPSGRVVEMLRKQVDSLKQDRDRAQSEVTSALDRAQAAEASAREATSLQARAAELDGQLAAAFLLIGERNERVAQLEDDLAEVKRIFREQVGVMVGQINAAKEEALVLRQSAATQ